VSSGLIGAGVLGATLISGFIVADTVKKPALDPVKNLGPKSQDKPQQVGESQTIHSNIPQPTAPEALQPELSPMLPPPQAKLVPRLASLPKLPAIVGSQAVPLVTQVAVSSPALANPSPTDLSSSPDNVKEFESVLTTIPDNLTPDTTSSSSLGAEGSEDAIKPFEQSVIATDSAQSTISTDSLASLQLGSSLDRTVSTNAAPAPSFNLPTPDQTISKTTAISAQPALPESPSSSLAEISLGPTVVNESGASTVLNPSTMAISVSEIEEKAIANQRQQVSAVSTNPPALLVGEHSSTMVSPLSNPGRNSTADQRQVSAVSVHPPVLLASQPMLTPSEQIPSASVLLQSGELKALLVAPPDGIDPAIPPLRSLTREEAQSFSQVDTLGRFTRHTLRLQDYMSVYHSISNQNQEFPPFGFIDYQHKLILLPDDSNAVVSLQMQLANQSMTQNAQLTSVVSPDR
jgi:hypothetical protein